MSEKEKNKYTEFISDEDFLSAAKYVISAAQEALDEAEEKLYKNALDPFSAVFDSFVNGVSLSEWLKAEKARQIQKTLQNALGDFHEMIIGSMEGWRRLPKGSVVDVESRNKKIIAEIKNKHNTTKGSDKKTLYDNLKHVLKDGSHEDFTGYYVEIIPKNPETYDKPFTPSDNVKGKRRAKRKNIRKIDGKSFYALASGHEDALRKIYEALPHVLADISEREPDLVEGDELFSELFEKTFE